MKKDTQNTAVLLAGVIVILVCLIYKCNNNKNNAESFVNTPYNLPHNIGVNQYNSQYGNDNHNNNNNNSKNSKNRSIKAVDPHLNNESHPYEYTSSQKSIGACMQDNLKEYRHSLKQKHGPVEYTNNKTHIGPQNNFHQCFANGGHNLRDLGWETMSKDLKKLNPNQSFHSNQENNPAATNYLENMKHQNLENVYF